MFWSVYWLENNSIKLINTTAKAAYRRKFIWAYDSKAIRILRSREASQQVAAMAPEQEAKSHIRYYKHIEERWNWKWLEAF